MKDIEIKGYKCPVCNCPTPDEIKALAEATATMIADKTNTIIAVMPNKEGKPVFITR